MCESLHYEDEAERNPNSVKVSAKSDNKSFGGDALRGNTRSHPEHDG